MRTRKLIAAVTAVLFLDAPVHAQQPPVLQPLKPWVVHYDDAECYAERTYQNDVILGIRPSPNGETYELLVAHKRAAPREAQQLQGSVNFGQRPVKAWLLRYGIKDHPYTVDKYRIDASDMALAHTAVAVTFHIVGGVDERFSLASIPGVMASLDKCNEDLRRYWNMGEAQQASIPQRAAGDVRSLFSDKDYPEEGWNQEGTARFLLFVDERGRVAACHVLKPSGVPAFDGMGCQIILQRAKFRPARGRDGKPVRDTVITPPVVWRMGF